MFLIISEKRHRGFTLIELLVVIAIIGILAGMILITLGMVREKARDARIISEMSQIRSAAATFYAGHNDSFTGFDCNVTEPELNMPLLCADISNQGGKKPSDGSAGVYIIASDQDFCAEVQLNSGKYWCIDATGISKSYDLNPSCGIPDYTCD